MKNNYFSLKFYQEICYQNYFLLQIKQNNFFQPRKCKYSIETNVSNSQKPWNKTLYGFKLYEYPRYIGQLEDFYNNSENLENLENLDNLNEMHSDHFQIENKQIDQNKIKNGQFYYNYEGEIDHTPYNKVDMSNIKEMLKKASPFSSKLQDFHENNKFKKDTLTNDPLLRKSIFYINEILFYSLDVANIGIQRKFLLDFKDQLIILNNLLESRKPNDLEDYSDHPIKDFQFEYRGLMLIITHYLQELNEFIVHNNSLQISSFLRESKILNLINRGNSLFILLKLGISLENIRNDKNQNLPFIDDLNIEDLDLFKSLNVEDNFVKLGNQLTPAMRLVMNFVVQATASHIYSNEYKNYPFISNAAFISANLYYSFFKKYAAKSYSLFYKTSQLDNILSFFNRIEGKYIKHATFSFLPSLKTMHNFNISPFNWNYNTDKNEYIENKIVKKNDQISLEQFREIGSNIYKLIPENYYSSQIKVKIISEYMPDSWKDLNLQTEFPWTHFIKSKAKSFVSNNESNSLFPETTIPTIMLFIHGGGFIAMNPDVYDSCTTLWSKKLKIPIISINYTKSPKASFPTQLEECWSVYNFIKDHSEKIFGSKVKIIINGDSAGGNLALALSLKLIQTGNELPDGLVISYPATYLAESPSSSRILSLIDPILNYGLLKLCTNTYTHPNSNPKTNPFLSPLVAPDEILKQFPPTYINVGSLDPLFDDAVCLAKRLDKLNGHVRLDVYDGLSHGYIQLNKIIPEAKEANNLLIEWVQALIQKFESESKH